MKGILSTIALSLTTLSFGQSINLSGKIVIDYQADYSLINEIKIANKKKEKIVKPDDEGSFMIEVQLNDELVFTSRFTDKRVIKMTESILKKGFITVHLDLDVIELAETNLTPLNAKLSDNINVDKTEVEELQDEVNNVSLEFRKKMLLEHEDAKARRTISEVGGVNLLGLGTAIFGVKNKSKPRIKSNFEVAEEIKKYFTITYFIHDLMIPEHKVNEFLGYCLKQSNLKKLFEKQKIEEMILYFEGESPNYLSSLN